MRKLRSPADWRGGAVGNIDVALRHGKNAELGLQGRSCAAFHLLKDLG